MTQQKRTRQNKSTAAWRGVTLIEIAIVLVIIGILLGGVLKGQELINNARVRALADQQNSIRVGWFSFYSRYGGMPGDFVFASQYIRDATNGNGDGILVMGESPMVFQQLAAAGYLRCQQCNESAEGSTPSIQNSLLNSYGGIMGIFHNGQFGLGQPINPITPPTYASRIPNDSSQQLMIHLGDKIPSNIITQVDLKIDDGIANEGVIVFNQWTVAGLGNNLPLACMSTSRATQDTPMKLVEATPVFYRHASENPLPNCGFSSFL